MATSLPMIEDHRNSTLCYRSIPRALAALKQLNPKSTMLSSRWHLRHATPAVRAAQSDVEDRLASLEKRIDSMEIFLVRIGETLLRLTVQQSTGHMGFSRMSAEQWLTFYSFLVPGQFLWLGPSWQSRPRNQGSFRPTPIHA
jgi:hypothetical protein